MLTLNSILRFFLLLAIASTNTTAQINESFNDGNFNTNPTWTGMESDFKVTSSGELQLNASSAGESFLVSSSQAIENATWECYIRMDFNPSSGNFARLYLASDNADLNLIQNGLYVEIGSTQDNICLYKVEKGIKKKLITGATDRINHSPVSIRIKVQRKGNEWFLQSDTGNDYTNEGTVNYSPLFESKYFGLYCKYTSTRKTKIFFDDIVVTGDPYKDKKPPQVSLFKLLNGSEIQLTFNKKLDERSITNQCFLLKNSKRHPDKLKWNKEDLSIALIFNPVLNDVVDEELLISALKDINGNTIKDVTFTFSYERTKIAGYKLLNKNTLELVFTKAIPPENFTNIRLMIDGNSVPITSFSDTADQKIYRVTFGYELDEGSYYTFTFSHLLDAMGDKVPLMTANLSYYFAKRFDVVINELMVDPTPSMGLPETEFIELYNTTEHAIDLDNWILDINGKRAGLPAAKILPHSYICLAPSSSFDLWTNMYNTIAIPNWPALTNTACNIVLYNNSYKVMDAYRFNRNKTIGEPFKTDGGWSVERIDAGNVSGEADNYHWSINLSGGTPGVTNSVNRKNKDTKAPNISKIELLNDTMLQINFSETMLLFDELRFGIKPNSIDYIQSIDTVFLNYVRLHFHRALPVNQICQLNQLNITDYAGHQLVLDDPLLFGLTDSLEAGDILINEVLFNPYPNGVDFIEIYNTSHKIIDVSDIFLATVNEGQTQKLYQAGTTKHMLLPQSYLVLTTNKTILQEQYLCKNPSALIEINTIPSMPNDAGTVTIANSKGQIMETFTYNRKMHFNLIKNDEGVSLERLSLTQATNNASNWHSAASTAGYATPGYLNSQTKQETNVPEHTFSVSPEVFTPNGNGNNDLLYIHFNNTERGGTASIRIYNSNGYLVRSLVNNESMASNGHFIWDGLSDTGEALQPSIYIIYIQCVYPSGKLIEEKLKCVIGVENKY